MFFSINFNDDENEEVEVQQKQAKVNKKVVNPNFQKKTKEEEAQKQFQATRLVISGKESGKLVLSNLNLTTTPKFLFHFDEIHPFLTELSENKNKNWWECSELTHLILRDNYIKYFGDIVEEDESNPKLLKQILAEDLAKFTQNKKLSAYLQPPSRNKYPVPKKNYKKISQSLQTVQQIDLSNNVITEIPIELFQLPSLLKLDLSNNSIAKIRNNHYLDLSIKYKEKNATNNNNLNNNLNEDKPINSNTHKETFLDKFNKLKQKQNEGQQKSIEEDEKENFFSPLLELHLKNNQLSSINQLRQFMIKNEFLSSTLRVLELQNNQLTSLPLQINNLTSLTSLSISNNRLENLPDQFAIELKTLRDLDLSHNLLSSFPNLSSLPNLLRLNLRHNLITLKNKKNNQNDQNDENDQSDDENDRENDNNDHKSDQKGPIISNKLKELFLGNNKINSIELFINNGEEKMDLITLELADNFIDKIILPENIDKIWASVERIDLSNNNLSSLSDRFGKLPLLKVLQVEGNVIQSKYMSISSHQLIEILKERNLAPPPPSPLRPAQRGQNNNLNNPKNISNAAELFGNNQLIQVVNNAINLSNKNLLNVPEELISDFSTVSDLNLSFNSIENLPDNFGELKVLEKFDLQNNKLKTINNSILNCAHLTAINLSHNSLTSLPSFSQLPYLQILNLDSNPNLFSTNRSIDLPSSLTFLSLSYCKIDDQIANELFESIGELNNLYTVNLSDNLMTQIHPYILEITTLRALYLHNNNLCQVNPKIGNLQLTHLTLHGNPLRTIPIAKLSLSVPKLLEYFRNKL